MIAIGISDFRAHIQKYLNYISKGGKFLITSRGKEIAKIIPPENKAITARKKLKKLSKTAVINNIIDPIPVDWKIK